MARVMKVRVSITVTEGYSEAITSQIERTCVDPAKLGEEIDRATMDALGHARAVNEATAVLEASASRPLELN